MRRTAAPKTSPRAAAANASSVEVCWMLEITASFLTRRCFGIDSAKKCAESCDRRTSVTNPANTRETARSGLCLRAIGLDAPPLDLRYLPVLQIDDPVDPVEEPEVVRSYQHRLAPFPALLHQDVHDLGAPLVVQVSGGLVREYHGCASDHAARDGGPLK